MLRLHCPLCQQTRDEEEFAYAGEAFIARAPESASDAQWGDYLFMRRNPKGWAWEQWHHVAGCRKVFAVKRHTVSYQIAGSWTLAEAKPMWERDIAAEGQR